jgi:sulfonate transport system substrate-binding protein
MRFAMKRRSLLHTAALAAPAAVLARPFVARAAGAGTLKVGYQKSSTSLVLLKSRGWLETKLAPLGYGVTWAEFPSGPPLLEALSANAVNLGFTGETPPIFAQASGTPIVYVGNTPGQPHSEAILAPKTSSLTSVADLKGKKVAVAKGSNAHYLLVASVLKVGLQFTDITPVYLAPADARAAFQSGDVDAWAIWDPFFAAAQATGNVKILGDASGVVPNHIFYLSRRDFASQHADALNAAIASVKEIEAWLPGNLPAAAAELSPSIGLPAPVMLTALRRQKYGLVKVSPAVLADQQKIADTFYRLNLIPSPITVADAAWS